MKKVLITGISGQDGSFLARLLLEKGYKVFGLTRKKTSLWRLEKLQLLEKITLFEHDYQNPNELSELLSQVQPEEIYNLAAQSSVQKSYEFPLETIQINSFWVVQILEWIRKDSPHTKFFQASSAEIFGNSEEIPQTETTKISPLNPYSSSKAFSYFITKNYRELYGLFCVNGILFNHDSELREAHFFTQKVCRHVAELYHRKKEILYLGNLHVYRDIGYAPEFVEGMYLSLNHTQAEDYIFSTGISHSLKKFVEYAFLSIGVSIVWEEVGAHLIGIEQKTGECLIKTDEKFFRKNDIQYLQGNPKKAKDLLGWSAKISLQELASIMVKNFLSYTHFTAI